MFSNKAIEAFKNKHSNDYSINSLNSLNVDYLFKNKICNINNNTNNNIYNNNNNFLGEFNQIIPKINSEHSLNYIDEKKLINDNNKIFDWTENAYNSGEINFTKFGNFGNSSFNNLSNPEYNINYKLFPSKSSSNGMIRIPSFGNMNYNNSFNNLNNINLTPNKPFIFDMRLNPSLNSLSNFNHMSSSMNLNNIKSTNINIFNNSKSNIFQLNPENLAKGTLLTPPSQIPFSLGPNSIMPKINEKNNTNYNYCNPIGENINSNNDTKNENMLKMLDKKRKRGMKNNKFVFMLGEENKKENKVTENENNSNNVNYPENTETPNPTMTNNIDSNEFDSEKSKKPRGSKFRGVSRNGNQWQVLIMVNKKKRYVGSYSKEEEAARAYDQVALQNHGSKAKTNFDYTKQEVEAILESPQLLKLY